MGTPNDYPRPRTVTPIHPEVAGLHEDGVEVVKRVVVGKSGKKLSRSGQRRLRRDRLAMTKNPIALSEPLMVDEEDSETEASGCENQSAVDSLRPYGFGPVGYERIQELDSAEPQGGVMLSIGTAQPRIAPRPPYTEEEYQKMLKKVRQIIRNERAMERAFTSDGPADISGGPEDIFGPADISALEYTWARPPPSDTIPLIDPWDTDLALLAFVPDRNDLLESARHTSRLLEAFANAGSPDSISNVQHRLLTTAVTTILSISREVRVQSALGGDTLHTLPGMDEDLLKPDSPCIVCYDRIADTVLVPCCHLVLCAVCFIQPIRSSWVVLLMRIGLLCGD